MSQDQSAEDPVTEAAASDDAPDDVGAGEAANSPQPQDGGAPNADPGEAAHPEAKEAAADAVDPAALKEQFEAFGKFGDKAADGKTIKLSQSDKWFKQAKVIDGKKISTTDTGIAFRKISKNSPKLSFADWLKYLDEIAKNKKADVNEIKGKLVLCGKPGLSGTTAVVKNSAMDRLTDSSKFGGTQKHKFDGQTSVKPAKKAPAKVTPAKAANSKGPSQNSKAN